MKYGVKKEQYLQKVKNYNYWKWPHFRNFFKWHGLFIYQKFLKSKIVFIQMIHNIMIVKVFEEKY